MTNQQTRNLYPHNVLARQAAALADDRKADRRKDTFAPSPMEKSRALFEQGLLGRNPWYTVATILEGKCVPVGTPDSAAGWLYTWFNVQLQWQGWVAACEAHDGALA